MALTNLCAQSTQSPHVSPLACSSEDMLSIQHTKTYVPLTTVVVEHVLAHPTLSPPAKLFYLLADMQAYNNKIYGHGSREIIRSGQDWEKDFGCKASAIYQKQKELEAQGYLCIERKKVKAKNEVNVLTPTLPSAVFQKLLQQGKKQFNAKGVTSTLDKTLYRTALDESLLFFTLNLEMFKHLLHANLTPVQKLIWLYSMMHTQINHLDKQSRQFCANHQQVAQALACSESTVSKAFKALQAAGFLSVNNLRLKETDSDSHRKDCSVYKLEALFPTEDMTQLKALNNRNPVDNSKAASPSFSKRTYPLSNSTYPFAQNDVNRIKHSYQSVLTKKTQPIVAHATTRQAQNPECLDIQALKHQQNLDRLPHFVQKSIAHLLRQLRDSQQLSGYAAKCAPESLLQEVIHHVVHYSSKSTPAQDKTHQALHVAKTLLRNGQWQTPRGWSEAKTLSIELNQCYQKYFEEGFLCQAFSEVERQVGQYLGEKVKIIENLKPSRECRL